MIIGLTIATCLLAAMAIILLGAQVELYEQVKQIRRLLDLTDSVTELEIKARNAIPSSAGLPADLDGASRAAVLFLSNKCATCQTLAASLRGGNLSRNLWLIVVPVGKDVAAFLNAYELVGDRILVDNGEKIASGLGLSVTPAALEVEGGRIVRAHTVPSVRHLRELSAAVAKTVDAAT